MPTGEERAPKAFGDRRAPCKPADDWEKRSVRKWGQIKWRGRGIRLSPALRGQYVGLKPVDDGRWAVYFEDLELGVLDERLGRVRPAARLATGPNRGERQ